MPGFVPQPSLHLVVDGSGTTHSNSPPGVPVINRGSSPLSWIGKLLDRLNPARLRPDDPGPKDCCNDIPTPIDPTACDKPGNDEAGCEYYQARHDDFVKRHECCEPPTEEPPPKYYLKYGWHYCDKFTTETYQRLSPQGQTRLQKVRCRLQEDMEEKLEDDPELELDGGRFEKFVLESHNAAYLDAGLWDLPCLDFSKVAVTYEPEAWEKIRSQWQALGIGAVKIGKCLFYDPVQWGVEQMGEGIKRLMEQLE